MKQKHHVHIYKVTGMIEMDINASDLKTAQEEALATAKNFEKKDPSKFKKADCHYVAVSFVAGGKS